MSKCNYPDCKKPNYKGYSQCILHCEKQPYFADINESIEFFNGFVDYVVNQVFSEGYISLNVSKSVGLNKFELKEFLEKINSKTEVEIQEISEKLSSLYGAHRPIILSGLIFTESQGRDSWDFMRILQLFKGIHFLGCKFSSHIFELPDSYVFFDGCTFYKSWSLYDFKLLPNVTKSIYSGCTFVENVGASGYEHQIFTISEMQFANCNLKEGLSLHFSEFGSPIFASILDDNNLSFIEIHESIIGDRFICNGSKDRLLNIARLSLYKVRFKQKFEFKNISCLDLKVVDCNFDGLADFYGSFFNEFTMEKSVFKQFAAFEDTIFGVSETPKPLATIFKYVTFHGFSNFRGAIFNDGLDIEKANFIQPPNFLKAKVPLGNTPRETFRIIKHSFDIVGNYIEANKFFALEMEKNKEDLRTQSNEDSEGSKEEVDKAKSDLFIFRFNQFFSDFGQSWQRPFWLIIALAVISQFFYCGLEDVGTHNSVVVTVFCEFSEVTKEFLCNHDAGWLVLLIVISSIRAWFYGRMPMFLFGLIAFWGLLKIIGISFPISLFLEPVINFLNHTVDKIPPFNKLLEDGHEFISFVINILFAVLIWQLVVSVKRLTRR